MLLAPDRQTDRQTDRPASAAADPETGGPAGSCAYPTTCGRRKGTQLKRGHGDKMVSAQKTMRLSRTLYAQIKFHMENIFNSEKKLWKKKKKKEDTMRKSFLASN